MTYHLKFRFIRRWASAAFAGIALVAQSAHADQGADLAIRLLQGVLGAAQQAGAQQTPPARSGGTMPVQLRSQPVYPSKEAWLVAVRQDIALPNAAQTRDYKRLAANVWLVLNTPEPVAGWPRDNVDWFGFEERVARGLRNTDQALALLLSDRPPTFMASSAEQVKREIGAVFQEIGNPAEMSGCRAGGQSCSDKLLAFFQEYVDAGLQAFKPNVSAASRAGSAKSKRACRLSSKSRRWWMSPNRSARRRKPSASASRPSEFAPRKNAGHASALLALVAERKLPSTLILEDL